MNEILFLGPRECIEEYKHDVQLLAVEFVTGMIVEGRYMWHTLLFRPCYHQRTSDGRRITCHRRILFQRLIHIRNGIQVVRVVRENVEVFCVEVGHETLAL